MHAVVRPYAAAGVALMGASVIAISPLAPLPDMAAAHRVVTSVNVELNAMVNPIDRWIQVLQKSAANIGAIGEQLAANPAPILSQVIANQVANATAFGVALQNAGFTASQIVESIPGALQTAAGQLQAGNVTGAVDTINNTIVIPAVLAALQVGSDALVPLTNIVNNFAKVVATLPTDVFTVTLPLTYPLLSAVNALVQTTQDVVNGVGAGDVGAVVNALVNAPANLVDGVLNGAGMVLGILPTAGILTPWDPSAGALDSGPIASLIALRQTIAEALGAAPLPVVLPGASAVASVPTAAKTVTLSTAAPEAPSATTEDTVVTKTTSAKPKVVSSASAAASAAPAAVESSGDSAGATSGGASGSGSGGAKSDSSSSAGEAGSTVKPGTGAAKPGATHKTGAASAKSAKAAKSDSSGAQD